MTACPERSTKSKNDAPTLDLARAAVPTKGYALRAREARQAAKRFSFPAAS
jgi:hypothetical protein